MYGLFTGTKKKSGRCREVAVSGDSTVPYLLHQTPLRLLNFWLFRCGFISNSGTEIFKGSAYFRIAFFKSLKTDSVNYL